MGSVPSVTQVVPLNFLTVTSLTFGKFWKTTTGKPSGPITMSLVITLPEERSSPTCDHSWSLNELSLQSPVLSTYPVTGVHDVAVVAALPKPSPSESIYQVGH